MISRFLAILLSVSLFSQGLASEEPVRTWTDVEGRTVEARFISLEGNTLIIQRYPDQQTFRFPLDRLSSQDRDYVVTRISEKKAQVDSPPSDPEKLEWPRRVSSEDFDVEIVSEDNATQTYIYRTPHFEFRSDVRLSRQVVRNFSTIFESTFAAVQSQPLRWNLRTPEKLFVCRLFGSRSDYESQGALPWSGGIYMPAIREIHIPVESLGLKKASSGYSLDPSGNNSTLIHEITHQVMHDWLGKLPIWVVEGSAVFMESVPYQRGEFRYDRSDARQYFSTRTGDTFSIRDLQEFMTMSGEQWNNNITRDNFLSSRYYNTAYLLYYYFACLDGDPPGMRFYRYLRALEAGESRDEALNRLLDGRSWKDLAKDIQRAFQRQRMNVTVSE